MFFIEGLVWLLVAIVWGYFAFRLNQLYRRTKMRIPQFLFYASCCFLFPILIGALLGFFFVNSLLILKWAIIISVFITAIGFSFFGYLIFYIKFPKISPKFGFLIVFILAILTLILYILLPPVPLVTPTGEVIWNLHFLPAVWFFLLATGTVLPFGIITIREGLSLQSLKEKIKALGLGIMSISGVIIIFFLVMIEALLVKRILLIIWAVSIFLLTYLTQKPPPYVKKL